MIGLRIEQLLEFGMCNNMIDKYDIPVVRNNLMAIFSLEEPYENYINREEDKKVKEIDTTTPLPILNELLDIAVEKGIIEDNITERDLLDAKIMGCLMPRQSELNRTFHSIAEQEGKEAATNYFYKLSQDSNYIRMDRIAKNMHWYADSEYGDLEITINLSKPEKDPKEIAKAKLLPQASYPKCLLCVENAGYEGRLNHPGRSNHRVIPITLDKEQWYYQYSPYVYYNEHSIIFKGKHEPMKISKGTFVRLMDFVDVLPHYFLGSNADLPIVGGSILSHDHFQGGNHTFPMEVAKSIATGKTDKYSDVQVDIVKWPLSVIRLSAEKKENIINLADDILTAWRNYSDESLGIFAKTDAPHNTITPISRRNEEGKYELDLVLRNNRQNEEHPDGIFHPHAHLHHIKKENIGLIEVMGLAVLPARLKTELGTIEKILTGTKSFDTLQEEEKEVMLKHKPFIDRLITTYGTTNIEETAKQIIEKEVGKIFKEVLECAGVYKMNEEGIAGMKRFLESIGIIC